MTASQDLVAARATVLSVLSEVEGGTTISTQQLLDRMQQAAVDAAKREKADQATVDQITHLAIEAGLDGASTESELRAFARNLLGWFDITPREDQCPF